MNDHKIQAILRQALVLETQERTLFLEQIDDPGLKSRVNYLLQDDTRLTAFMVETSAGSQVLEQPDFQHLKSGDRINRFLIIKLIAQGGMGAVYLAFDEKLKRNVALKAIRPEFLQNSTSQKRFEREAQILSQVNHPSICQIYDYIESTCGDLLVLELVDGTNLGQHQLDQEDMLSVLIQIASALAVAHEKGVIHRDLKPDNIMLTAEGQVKVLDFGIAKSGTIKSSEAIAQQHDPKAENNITQVGSLMGTLVYMSPEQAAMQDVSTASDLYSFGVIMQELLTQQPAYVFNDTESLRQQVINAQLVQPESLSKDYQNLINALTQKETNNRPDAKQLVERLTVIKNKPLETKKKVISVVSAAVMVAMLLFISWQWHSHNTSRDQAEFIKTISTETQALNDALKNVYALPLHDISQNRAKLTSKQNQLLSQIEQTDLLSEIEKKQFQAEVYFANEDYYAALPLLNEVWQAGIQTAEVALRLAYVNNFVFYQEVFLHEYREGYESEAHYMGLAEQYFLPAIEYMQFSQATNDKQVSLPLALATWQEGEVETALAMLDEMISNEDWLFDAYSLKAEILSSEGYDYGDAGEELKSRAFFESAKQVYLETINRGRSYPKAYLGLCDTMRNVMSYSSLHEAVDEYETAVQACENLLVIEPQKVEALTLLAIVNYQYGYALIRSGQSGSSYFLSALDWLTQAMDKEPIYRHHEIKGKVLLLQALEQSLSGEDPFAKLDASAAAFKSALALQPKVVQYLYASLIDVQNMLLTQKYYRGSQLFDEVAQARQYHELGMADPELTVIGRYYLNNGLAHAIISAAEFAALKQENPTTLLQEAITILSSDLAAVEGDSSVFALLAKAYYELAHHQFEHDINPQESLTLADKHTDIALEYQQDDVDHLTLKGKIVVLQSLINQQSNDQIKPDFAEAQRYFELALNINPKSLNTLTAHANQLLWQAKLSTGAKERKQLISSAVDLSSAALEVNPRHGFTYALQAELLTYGQHIGLFENKQQDIHQLWQQAQMLNPYLLP